jgi:hypothetical protein
MKNYIFLLATLSITTMHASDLGKPSLSEPVEIIVAPTQSSGVVHVQLNPLVLHKTPHEVHTALSRRYNTNHGILTVVHERFGICNISKIMDRKLHQINYQTIWFLAHPQTRWPYNDFRSKVDYICD